MANYNDKDIREKLGVFDKNGNGSSGNNDPNPSGAGERKEIKLKRIVKFAHFKEDGTLSDEAETTWMFTGTTGSSVQVLQHHNQFAMVEIDGAEYMVRWHKALAYSPHYEGQEDKEVFKSI